MAELQSIDPATGEPVGSVPITPVEAVADIVSVAHAAQPAWAALGSEGRMDALRAVGPRILDRAGAIGEQLTREMGKPLREATGEVRSTATGLEAELLEMHRALEPETLEDGRTRTVLHHDALGVAACITPWNFPFSMPHWMVLPALMAGNTVVLKPSEETPLTGQAYVDCFEGLLPDGVLQVIHGADQQGKALVAADVDLIAFTGSREVGKLILGSAAQGLKRVVLELGGKDPMLVLDDADLERAAAFAARNSFRNCGQVCVSTERIYVSQALYPDFLEALRRRAGELVVGHGLDEGTTLGPMINATQRNHVLRQVRSAISMGAEPVLGGEEAAAEAAPANNFLRPTILAGVTHDMDIAREETFGPVACVTPVADEDEAVRLANDTPYGLGAVVFGEDIERAQRVARQLTAGMIGINRGVGGAQGSPWVGARQSGFGFHSGRDGHRQFAQTRIVSLPS
jgi:acyl-CoA reductase-like NAD-dependent aldehyde dehydrogenase